MSLERRNLRFDFEIRKTRSDHSLCEQSVNEILCNIHAMHGMQIHKQGFAYIYCGECLYVHAGERKSE